MDIALAPGAQVFAAGVCYSIVGSIVRHAFEAITHFDVSSSERLTFSHCCDSVNSRILRILMPRSLGFVSTDDASATDAGQRGTDEACLCHVGSF